jgi:hypothetical protein
MKLRAQYTSPRGASWWLGVLIVANGVPVAADNPPSPTRPQGERPPAAPATQGDTALDALRGCLATLRAGESLDAVQTARLTALAGHPDDRIRGLAGRLLAEGQDATLTPRVSAEIETLSARELQDRKPGPIDALLASEKLPEETKALETDRKNVERAAKEVAVAFGRWGLLRERLLTQASKAREILSGDKGEKAALERRIALLRERANGGPFYELSEPEKRRLEDYLLTPRGSTPVDEPPVRLGQVQSPEGLIRSQRQVLDAYEILGRRLPGALREMPDETDAMHAALNEIEGRWKPVDEPGGKQTYAGALKALRKPSVAKQASAAPAAPAAGPRGEARP